MMAEAKSPEAELASEATESLAPPVDAVPATTTAEICADPSRASQTEDATPVPAENDVVDPMATGEPHSGGH